MAQRSTRRFLVVVHLYLGIVLGLFFSVLGLSGSVLVFYPEIDRLLNPELIQKVQQPVEIRYQAVFDQLRRYYPQRLGAWRIEVPREPDQPVVARYLKPEEKDPTRFAPMIVAMNPRTLEIIHSRFWGDDPTTWIYDLHYSLLVGSSGKLLVGAIGLLFLMTLLIGVFLWLPRGRNRLGKTLPKVRSGSVKTIYDLHTYSGAYSAVLMVVLIVTGVGLATPQWISPLVEQFSHRLPEPVPESVLPRKETVRISADRAIEAAYAKFPRAGLRWIQSPVSATDVYFLRLKQPGEPSDRFPKTYVWIDQFSADVISFRDPLKAQAADVFFDWLHPLHNGEAFGLLGRLLVFFVGMLPVFLFVTGIWRWRQKVRSKEAMIK
jgi:uncharacterized iron-regulated membrane protein